ncbi:formate--tetrahydrofolate ligase [Sphaerobacter thermophilus]|uniref:Formate--tetrahydrofolate ligase n=1 Tax=Sphaerobacter thermophilus (strain ATCC 49802 / DSM 20745 / KCCM 41009 / NCIMB 13125 / S 6022) TaxID=479434 RepID=D1C3C3_SPHTD|nr:formate--tetrahydrofolate ligase [Sphaerobacter thermophilus]ACZ38740.1 Formate--tetrahydrofolate ligase [Sphaerobacter thermophilus DSM 20745]
MLTDIEIASQVTPKPITEIAADLGIQPDELELYGPYKAKISLSIRDRLKDRPNGKYVVVTAITPTPLGEGKTTVTVGLGQAFGKIGTRAIVAIRQPSLGPVFGIKGGAAGGGYSQIIPMEDFNLHLTGDFHAVTAAHNLCAAFLDNSIYHGNPLDIDQTAVLWRRVMDVNDRTLRDIVIGLGSGNGIPRQTGFDITAASEVMAVLALATDYRDLRERLGRLVVALNRKKEPVTAEDIGVAGAMAALLKDALKPNLLQTLEHTPAIVHAGPFGNIAHGNSSVLADLIGLKLADVVVTEAGFGADLGFEKFCDIKCRVSGLKPDAAVLVATIRALKAHSGRYKIVAGKPLDPGLVTENLDALREGIGNLEKQIENVRRFGVPVVVAINQFPTDTPAEIELVREVALKAGAFDAVPTRVHSEGGEGGADLARAVLRATEEPNSFRPLYELDMPLTDKIEIIARELYGAGSVTYQPAAARALRTFTSMGYDKLPVCMAKTHLSLSGDPNLRGRPEGFELTVREARLSAGAGFIYPIIGEMRTMPGLGSKPGGLNVDIDDDGTIRGLF